MRPLSRLTPVRLFSVCRTKVPPHITDKFNEFHINNQGHIKSFLDFNTIKKIGANLLDDLQNQAVQGDQDSMNFLNSIDSYKKGKSTGLFLSEGPGEGRASTYFTDTICFLLGYRPIEKNGKRKEIIIDPESQGLEIITPHVDGVFPSKEPLDVVTIVGSKADKGNYRTAMIKIEDVLKELPENVIQILCEPIFFRKGKKIDSDAKAIFYKQEDGSIRANFIASQSALYEVNLPKDSDISIKDANNAVKQLNDLLMDFFLNRELESFYVKTGFNEKGQKIADSFIIGNDRGFHLRDQKGVPMEDLDFVRIVISDDYTKITDETQKPPKIILGDFKASSLKGNVENSKLGGR